MLSKAVTELIYKIADDHLILGHRNSEWTGIGPLLEEDIAFASMAQDKVGQAKALYELLHKHGEGAPDLIAFNRNEKEFHCCQFVELPIGEYDFSLIRHFLFDVAAYHRFEVLRQSSELELAQIAKKFFGEVKYHQLHAKIWIKQLGSSSHEAVERLQNSLNYAFPYALGIFEHSPFEAELIAEGVFPGEDFIKAKWLDSVKLILADTALELPEVSIATPVFGGRVGNHTEYLQPLLEEMTEVFRVDPTADW